MKITLAQLEVFHLIAKHQSVSLAADACFISQAAASMRLSQLEKLLNQPLFDREGKHLIINSVGKQLLPQANHIVQMVAEFEATSANPDTMTGQLHIGASTTIANNVLPDLINQFLKQYPDVNIEITMSNAKTCVDKLLNFEVDIALVEGIYLHPKVEFKPWLQDQLHLFCHPSHPLTKQKSVKLADLSQYPWVLREPTSGTRQVIESALQQSPIKINNVMVVNSSQAIKNIVRGNKKAIGCLPEAVLKQDLKAKKLAVIKVKEWQLKRYFYLACYLDKSNNAVSQCFEAFLLQQLDKVN